MKEHENSKPYCAVSGAAHDERFSKLSPLKDALHLFVRMVLEDELPEDTKMLVVGAGTGPELIYLAEVFPKWNFTAVEPDKRMLETCRKKCEESNILPRCTFHDGTLETLPGSELFSSATSILVSHFLPSREERCIFYRGIASRLVSNGLLVSADLISQVPLDDSTSLLEIWTRTMKYANAPVPPRVPAITPQEMGSIVESGGFEAPTYFYQALLIHAWFARRCVN